MDNASIHRTIEFKDMCTRLGLIVEYLPPYSPDFNPIEQTFNVLKQWIRTNWTDSRRFEDFGDFLAYAVREVAEKDARGHYKDCKYEV